MAKKFSLARIRESIVFKAAVANFYRLFPECNAVESALQTSTA